MKLKIQYPEAKIVAHPESEPHVLDVANFVGSTSKMIAYIEQSASTSFIVGTEVGLLHELSKRVPEKTLIPLPTHEDNTCACSECAFMKVNTLEKVYRCLAFEEPEIKVDPHIFEDAKAPLVKMINFPSQVLQKS